MKLKKEEIEHVANLARLELSDEEVKNYSEQLSGILSYIDQLQEVDTDNVEETAQITGIVNAFREDENGDWDIDEKNAALCEAPEIEEKQLKVKRVLN